MKQVIQILIISLSLVFGNLNAQRIAKINVDELAKLPVARNAFDILNVEVGINSSSTTNHIDYNRRTGISFGVSTDMDGSTVPFVRDVPIINDFRYKIGMNFEQFGSKWSDSEEWEGGEYSNKIKFRFNYLSMPLTIQHEINFLPCETYFMWGLKPRILLGGKESWKYKYVYYSGDIEYSDTEKGDEDIKDNLKHLDFGFVLGIGKPFSLKGQNFIAELNYEFGLRDISDFNTEESNSSSLKNNSILARFAWQLAL